MKNNPFIDLPSSCTIMVPGMSGTGWRTVSRRRGGRKNGYGRLGGGEPVEEVLFPLRPRRDLSWEMHCERY